MEAFCSTSCNKARVLTRNRISHEFKNTSQGKCSKRSKSSPDRSKVESIIVQNLRETSGKNELKNLQKQILFHKMRISKSNRQDGYKNEVFDNSIDTLTSNNTETHENTQFEICARPNYECPEKFKEIPKGTLKTRPSLHVASILTRSRTSQESKDAAEENLNRSQDFRHSLMDMPQNVHNQSSVDAASNLKEDSGEKVLKSSPLNCLKSNVPNKLNKNELPVKRKSKIIKEVSMQKKKMTKSTRRSINLCKIDSEYQIKEISTEKQFKDFIPPNELSCILSKSPYKQKGTATVRKKSLCLNNSIKAIDSSTKIPLRKSTRILAGKMNRQTISRKEIPADLIEAVAEKNINDKSSSLGLRNRMHPYSKDECSTPYHEIPQEMKKMLKFCYYDANSDLNCETSNQLNESANQKLTVTESSDISYNIRSKPVSDDVKTATSEAEMETSKNIRQNEFTSCRSEALDNMENAASDKVLKTVTSESEMVTSESIHQNESSSSRSGALDNMENAVSDKDLKTVTGESEMETSKSIRQDESSSSGSGASDNMENAVSDKDLKTVTSESEMETSESICQNESFSSRSGAFDDMENSASDKDLIPEPCNSRQVPLKENILKEELLAALKRSVENVPTSQSLLISDTETIPVLKAPSGKKLSEFEDEMRRAVKKLVDDLKPDDRQNCLMEIKYFNLTLRVAMFFK